MNWWTFGLDLSLFFIGLSYFIFGIKRDDFLVVIGALVMGVTGTFLVKLVVKA